MGFDELQKWIDEQYRIFRRGEDTKTVPLPYTDEDEMVQPDVHVRAIDQFDDDDDEGGNDDGDDTVERRDDVDDDDDDESDDNDDDNNNESPSHATCHVPTPSGAD